MCFVSMCQSQFTTEPVANKTRIWIWNMQNKFYNTYHSTIPTDVISHLFLQFNIDHCQSFIYDVLLSSRSFERERRKNYLESNASCVLFHILRLPLFCQFRECAMFFCSLDVNFLCACEMVGIAWLNGKTKHNSKHSEWLDTAQVNKYNKKSNVWCIFLCIKRCTEWVEQEEWYENIMTTSGFL